MWRVLLTATVTVCLAGCVSGPLYDNPIRLGVKPNAAGGNPVYLPQGPMSYDRVYMRALDVLSDYWEIGNQSRYDGRIETRPRVAPGVGQPWKPGSPDFYQRLLATFQTIRDRAVVTITIAEDGGYFLDVKVYKELEDLAEPARSTAGAATFRLENTVAREFEVVEEVQFESGWIPIGRDLLLEQVLLERLSRLDFTDCP